MDNADIRLDFGLRLECNFLKATIQEASVKAAMRPMRPTSVENFDG